MSDPGNPVDAYIVDQPATLRPILDAARELIREALPSATETVKWHKPTYVVDGENVCYLAAQTEWVTLGFFAGTSLTDPEGLLEGAGDAMRHVKLRSVEDVADPALRELVVEAIQTP